MRRMVLMFMIALVSCAPALHADPAGDARRAIRSAYADMDAAITHKDMAGATACLAPSYTSTNTKGVISGVAQERQAAVQVFAQAQSISSKTGLVSLTLDTPIQATVVVRSQVVMLLTTTAQAGKPVQAVLRGTSRDTWIKTPQGWREKHNQDLTQTFTFNGKPLPKS